MKRIFNCFSVAMALVFIGSAAQRGFTTLAQSAPPANLTSDNKSVLSIDTPSPQALLRRQILDVLNSTAYEARKWDDRVVAARTQARIADLVWDTDPEGASNHLKAAWDAALQVAEPKSERSTIVNPPSLRSSVRREILLVARKRAPELAAKWLKELTEESNSGTKEERGTFDDRSARSAVLLQMANAIVDDNPQGAAELLTESLYDGISFNFQSVLVRLQLKDSALASTVFRAALARLRAAGMADPNELLTLYSYLYTPGRVHSANTSDNRNQVQLALGGPRIAVTAAQQNPAMAREFLEVASDLLLAVPLPDANGQAMARSLVSTIGILMRQVTELMPEKAALLRARAQQLDSEATFSTTPLPPRADLPDVRPGESQESFAERRVDLLEEAAAKGRDVLTRDIGYAVAAVATTVERYDRGLDLIGKIDDKDLRAGIRSWLIYRAVLHLITSDRLDEAQRLNSKNEDATARAVCMVAGAQRLVAQKDTERAREWLREAGALVKSSEPNETVPKIALGIVSTLGRFDTQAALDWLVFAVKVIPKASPASLNQDKAPSLKRISGITPVSDFTADTTGFSLHAALAVFSPDQFEQVHSILNGITPAETRGLAVLTLCDNSLKTMPNEKAPSQRSAPK